MNQVRVSVEDIQRDLPAYLKRVEEGDTLVIVRAGHPVAEIKSIAPCPGKLRPFGLCSGEFTVPEDFNAPLPENILNTFITADPVFEMYPAPILARI